MCESASIPHIKINVLFYAAPCFSKSFLNPQDQQSGKQTLFWLNLSCEYLLNFLSNWLFYNYLETFSIFYQITGNFIWLSQNWPSTFLLVRSSHLRCFFFKKGILRTSQNSQENTYARDFFNNDNLLNKSPKHKCFPVTFVKCLRTSFLQNTSGPLLLSLCLQVSISH